MSTKALNELLSWVNRNHPVGEPGRLTAAALDELERIEAAAKAMTAEDVTPEQVREANATLESIAREAP